MKCRYTITVTSKYGQIYPIPCGWCIACRKRKAGQWALRLMMENKTSEKSCFLTLTYSPEKLPKNGTLVKEHLQYYFRALRKSKFKIRYFAAGEYGDLSLRPHYHIILYGMNQMDYLALQKYWSYGNIYLGELNIKTAKYTASYVVKKLTGKMEEEYLIRGVIPEFALMSRKPALGQAYFNQYGDFFKQQKFIYHEGVKYGIPRTYTKNVQKSLAQDFTESRDCIYRQSDEERTLKENRGYSDKDYTEYLRGLYQQQQKIAKAKTQLKKGIL